MNETNMTLSLLIVLVLLLRKKLSAPSYQLLFLLLSYAFLSVENLPVRRYNEIITTAQQEKERSR